MNRIFTTGALLAALVAHGAPPASAQDYEDIVYSRYLEPHGFSVAYPSSWQVQPVEGCSAAFFADDQSANCTLKRTADWAFSIVDDAQWVQNQLGNRQLLQDGLPMRFLKEMLR